MKASELRIGNYVYRQSSKLIVDKSSVYQIENVNLQSALKYEPILLTEEWLLKFGFIKSGTNTDTHWFKCDNEGISRIGLKQYKELFNNNHVSFDFNVGGAYSISSVDIKIEFVHQFQNLYFALTGEELAVNN